MTLDMEALAHLSRMPVLTELSCKLSDTFTFPPSDSSIIYSNLHYLKLLSRHLTPISQLLSGTQLPAIIHVTAFVESYPSKQRLSSFLACVLTSAIGRTIQRLSCEFEEPESSSVLDEEDEEDGAHVLKFEDLQPCVALSNLRHIFLSLFWDVDLTNSELVTLASAWPHLEGLLINAQRGWNTPGGITPNRVVQLL